MVRVTRLHPTNRWKTRYEHRRLVTELSSSTNNVGGNSLGGLVGKYYCSEERSKRFNSNKPFARTAKRDPSTDQRCCGCGKFSRCTQTLRELSNEINHLSDLYGQLYQTNGKETKIMGDLEGIFFDLKRNLTATGVLVCEEERERARRTGNQLRLGVLKVIFGVCGAVEKI